MSNNIGEKSLLTAIAAANSVKNDFKYLHIHIGPMYTDKKTVNETRSLHTYRIRTLDYNLVSIRVLSRIESRF